MHMYTTRYSFGFGIGAGHQSHYLFGNHIKINARCIEACLPADKLKPSYFTTQG